MEEYKENISGLCCQVIVEFSHRQREGLRSRIRKEREREREIERENVIGCTE